MENIGTKKKKKNPENINIRSEYHHPHVQLERTQLLRKDTKFVLTVLEFDQLQLSKIR